MARPSTHTPGPWTLGPGGTNVYGPLGDTGMVASCGSLIGRRLAERVANARLVAAAPDLLAVAKLARETAITVLGEVKDENVRQWVEDLFTAADSAIARAEGARP